MKMKYSFYGVVYGKTVEEAESKIMDSIKQGGYELKEMTVITSPDTARERLSYIVEESQEVFVAAFLNVKNEVLKIMEVARGSHNSLLLAPREVLIPALKAGAVNILLAHNHPSGDPAPSPEDLSFTKKMKIAVEIVGLQLLDHLIFAERGYFSFKQEDLL